MNTSSLPSWAPVVLRFTMCAVFLYFGITQLTSPEVWTGLVPEWLTNLTGMSASTFVTINAIFEIVASVLLLLGAFVRPVATLLFLHLLGIAFTLGFNPLGVRDFGLAFATLAVAIYGNDQWCLLTKKHL